MSRLIGTWQSCSVLTQAADDQSDWQPYTYHVRDDGDDSRGDCERPVTIAREWHHDPIHYEINGHTIRDAREDGASGHECEPAAGEIKNGGSGKCDEEMKGESERRDSCATAVGLRTEQAGRDAFENPGRRDAFWPPGDECGGDVHDAASEPRPEDGRQCARATRIVQRIHIRGYLTMKQRRKPRVPPGG